MFKFKFESLYKEWNEASAAIVCVVGDVSLTLCNMVLSLSAIVCVVGNVSLTLCYMVLSLSDSVIHFTGKHWSQTLISHKMMNIHEHPIADDCT